MITQIKNLAFEASEIVNSNIKRAVVIKRAKVGLTGNP